MASYRHSIISGKKCFGVAASIYGWTRQHINSDLEKWDICWKKDTLIGETAVTKNNDKTNLLEEQHQSKYVMQVFSCDKESMLERYSIKSPKIHYTLTYNHTN